MTMQLFAHPFSSYCQKAEIAFYENGIDVDFRLLDGDPATAAEFSGLWPIGKFPMLVDDGRVIFESTSIIEHLAAYHPGPVALIPADAAAAVEVRMLDRFFDNYVMNAMQPIVANALRPEAERDPRALTDAHAMLDKSYAWLEARMADREWAAGAGFTLADAAAAPSLFYADWAYPLGDQYPAVTAYRRRLLARPSFARAVDEARPYRHYFPLGAPDRD